MGNSVGLNLYLLCTLGIFMGACSSEAPCHDQLREQEQEISQLRESMGYSGLLHQTLTEKVSDLIAYVEKTWREEGSVEAALARPQTNMKSLLLRLKDADLAVTFARKRVSEINAILSSLDMGSMQSDQIRDRLRRMDEVLMEKEILFNQIRRSAEEKQDPSFVRQTLAESRMDLGRIPLPADGLATEISGLKRDLEEARLTLSSQNELIDAYEQKLRGQQLLQQEMKSLIYAKEMALMQSERYKNLLEKDISLLEEQRGRLLKEVDSIFLAVEAEKAHVFLQIAQDLTEEVESIKLRKNKREIVQLAESYYQRARYCNCAPIQLTENMRILKEKYLD